jgi:hypothetical protein
MIQVTRVWNEEEEARRRGLYTRLVLTNAGDHKQTSLRLHAAHKRPNLGPLVEAMHLRTLGTCC